MERGPRYSFSIFHGGGALIARLGDNNGPEKGSQRIYRSLVALVDSILTNGQQRTNSRSIAFKNSERSFVALASALSTRAATRCAYC